MKHWVLSYIHAVKLLFRVWLYRRAIHKNTGVWPETTIEVNEKIAAWFPRGNSSMRSVKEYTEK